MPKVSVIITTHNRPHLLHQAIESAQAAGADIELIVVDDASTDETANVCKELSGIRYLRVERNQKVAGARNIGIPPDHPTLPAILKGGRLSIRTDRQMTFGHIARFRPRCRAATTISMASVAAQSIISRTKSGPPATGARDLWHGDVRINQTPGASQV